MRHYCKFSSSYPQENSITGMTIGPFLLPISADLTEWLIREEACGRAGKPAKISSRTSPIVRAKSEGGRPFKPGSAILEPLGRPSAADQETGRGMLDRESANQVLLGSTGSARDVSPDGQGHERVASGPPLILRRPNKYWRAALRRSSRISSRTMPSKYFVYLFTIDYQPEAYVARSDTYYREEVGNERSTGNAH